MSVFGKNQYTTICILTILTFAMLPVYLFSSGGFQIVDAVIMLLSLAIFIAVDASEMRVALYVINPFLPFVSWSVIINSYYSMETVSKAGYFLSTIQLVFGFYILFLFAIVFNRILSNQKGVTYLYWGLLASCMTPWLLEAKGGIKRCALSFNNPNQLAYYAILVLSMLLLINFVNTKARRNTTHRILNIIILALSNVFAVVSASRAGIVVVLLLDVYFFYTTLKEYKKLIFLLIFLLPAIVTLVMHKRNMNYSDDAVNTEYLQLIQERFDKHDILQNLQKRIFGHVGDKIDFCIIFGSGADKGRLGEQVVEGTLMREAHNALMEIYDSYGIVGMVLFLGGAVFFFFRLGSFQYKWFFFAVLLLYNTAHNGIRFRSMWLAVGFISIVSVIINKRQANKYYQLSELQSVNQHDKL